MIKRTTPSGRLRAAAVSIAMLILSAGLSVPPAAAFRNGITGYSGRGNQTCNACHVGGTVPEDARFEGPTEVAAGATATFRFVVVSEAPSQDEAGFNVAASAGSLRVIAGQNARFSSNELTHTGPKAIDDDFEAAWQFNWIAPATAGEQTLFGAGNAVNGNRDTSGDRARTTTFKIQVVGGTPTPTATATPLATHTDTPTTMPTVTATATIVPSPTVTETSTALPDPSPSATASPTDFAVLPTASPTQTTSPPCVGDCDADQRVTVAELVTGVNIAFERMVVTACRALDRDTDERVTVAELVEAVRRLLEGC